MSLGFLVIAVAIFANTLSTQRKLLSPGVYGMSVVGMVTGIAATLMFGTALVTFMTSTTRGPPLGRLVTALWNGVAGRILFRLAGWKLPATAASPVARLESRRGPAAVLAALAPRLKRALGGVSAGIATLEAEALQLDARISRLEVALQEARAGVTPGAETTGEASRSSFAAEAEAALVAARSRRLAIASGLELLRLQLLRFSGGLGVADDVKRALREAAPSD